MTQKIFIDGAAGTTGLEIAGRLSGRDEFSLISLNDKERKDTAARAEAMNSADFVILCLPDDAAREAVSLINKDHVRVIDASSAHRISDNWVYGFAEMRQGQRNAIKNARLVSNPGCYPTGFLALVAPLVAAEVLPDDFGYIVHAVSGYSGGGKALIQHMEEDGADIGWRGYGLNLNHKHLPEMQVHAGLARAPLFSPAVVRAFRGMVVEVPLFLDDELGFCPPSILHETLEEHYAGEPLVRLMPFEEDTRPSALLLHSVEQPHDGLTLHVLPSDDGQQVRLIAMLDNLGKGASGAAVQNLNIMAGLDEELSGLRLI